MTRWRVLVVAVTTSALLAVPAGPAAAAGGGDDFDTIRTDIDDRAKAFNLHSRWAAGAAARPARPAVLKPQEPQPVPTYRNRLICYTDTGRPEMAPEDGWCQSGIPLTPRSDCEQLTVLPTWRQWTYPDGTTGDWELLDRGSCEPVLPVLTVEDFRSLPIPAPVLRLQPDRGWVLVNIETIVMTDPAPVPLRTTLAGFGVDVEAVPTHYSYDFGDGHTLDTRSPGARHPHHDTFHEYEAPGTYAITLTTEWAGRYRVDGDPTWRDVTGTATTSATSPPFTAEERTSRLVDSLCTDVPTPPDC